MEKTSESICRHVCDFKKRKPNIRPAQHTTCNCQDQWKLQRTKKTLEWMFPFWKWLFFQHLKNPKGIWNFDGFWTVKESKTDPKTFLIFLNYCNHRVRKTQRHLQFTKKFSLFKKLKRPQKTSANLLGNSRKGNPLSRSKEAQMTQRTLACTFLEMALSFGRERERDVIFLLNLPPHLFGSLFDQSIPMQSLFVRSH